MQALPIDCDAYYQANFLSLQQCEFIYSTIKDMGIAEFKVVPSARWGKLMLMDDALFDKGLLPEAAWGKTSKWLAGLDELAAKLSKLLNWSFHTCVCIYYPDGNEGVDFHSDHPAFGDTSVIASLSIGAERIFQLRNKATGEVFSKKLEEGSLIVMGHGCQEKYEHALPLAPNCTEPRLNLTFRRFGSLEINRSKTYPGSETGSTS